MGKSGAAALQEWCRVACSGYPGVNITNMSSAWRDGRAFCAVIHRYRPDVLHWDQVDTRHWERNCHLAFTVAEEQLGIPRLLDVEDVISHPSPDRLSILTYISQFYHKLAHSGPDSGISSLSQSPASSDSEAESLIVSSSSAERRGAILSLMDGRRARSVSCHARRRERCEVRRPPSPPIEQENPFKNEVFQNMKPVKSSPSRKLLDKVKYKSPGTNSDQISLDKRSLRKKEGNYYTGPRMVQSMYVESRNDVSLNDISIQTSAHTRPSLITTAIPKPYKNIKTENSVSILCKTEKYLQERKRRSQSQPSEKREKKKFEFLSTSSYDAKQAGDTKDNKASEYQSSDVNKKGNTVLKENDADNRSHLESNFKDSCDNLVFTRRSDIHIERKMVLKPKGYQVLDIYKLHNVRPFLQTLV